MQSETYLVWLPEGKHTIVLLTFYFWSLFVTVITPTIFLAHTRDMHQNDRLRQESTATALLRHTLHILIDMNELVN